MTPGTHGRRKVGIDVEEAGPGDVACLVGFTAFAGFAEVPARVDDSERVVIQVLGQPGDVDERPKAGAQRRQPNNALDNSFQYRGPTRRGIQAPMIRVVGFTRAWVIDLGMQ